MSRRRFGGLILILGLWVAACGNQPTAAPSPQPSGPQSGLAQVSSVEVLQLASPSVEVRVVAHGQLADGCTRLDEARVERVATTFSVTLPTTRIAQAECPPGPIDFERSISLDLTGAGPGAYTVVVNGATGAFELSGSGGAQIAPPATQALPTPTSPPPTEALAVTSSSAPTSQPAAPAPTPAPAADTNCVNKLAFFADVTIPDDTAFRQGDTFVKTWKLRNEGTCTLDNHYSLVFGGGDQMNGPLSQPLTDPIDPGEIFEVSVNLTAPSRGGPHVGNWQFQSPSGKHFGVGVAGADYVWVKIVVSYVGGSSGTGASSGAGAGSGASSTVGCGAQQNGAYEGEVLSLINNVRAANGLPGLAAQGPLMAAALRHSIDMACNDFVDHTGTDGSTWYARIQAQGYAYSTAKENIYVGSPDFGGAPAGAFDWWMNSQIHRDNILSADISSIGVAYVYYSGSTYGGYYTVVFARP